MTMNISPSNTQPTGGTLQDIGKALFDEPTTVLQLLGAYLQGQASPASYLSLLRKMLPYGRLQFAAAWDGRAFLQGLYFLFSRKIMTISIAAFCVQMLLVFLMVFSNSYFYSHWVRALLPFFFLFLFVGVNVAIAFTGRYFHCRRFLADLERAQYGKAPIEAVAEEMRKMGAPSIPWVLGGAVAYATILGPVIIFLVYRISLVILHLVV